MFYPGNKKRKKKNKKSKDLQKKKKCFNYNSILPFSGTLNPLHEVKSKTGADVHFDPNPSAVPGMKILIIRGVPYHMEAAIRLITEMIGAEVCKAQGH